MNGRDLSQDPAFQQAWATRTDEASEHLLASVASELDDTADLAASFADRIATEMFRHVTGLDDQADQVWSLAAAVQAGVGWDEPARVAGLAAAQELARLLQPVLDQRAAATDGDDLLAVLSGLGATGEDVVITLLELDLTTLAASMANLWCLLLTTPSQLEAVRAEPRLMKFAYLEALRHSPPQATADRFARHEVERFGRLIPAGALLHLSAAAANRDPRQFEDPNVFDIARKDLCQREPRGQYRADGLPAGIVFGHGRPSLLPAAPRDAPRSRYAVTRDLAVAASLLLLERGPVLAGGALPAMSLDRIGGTYRCRSLPVTLASP